MKKMLLIAMAVTLGVAVSMPAAAVENEFGGYWRTRASSEIDFDGTENGPHSGTNSRVDTRTKLYYTAKFNENFKFVNKFEIDNYWGDDTGGDIGADGKIIEVKNTYIDFNAANHNFKIGIQPAVIARGFMFDDDFAGVTATCNIGSMALPFIWMKTSDKDLDTDYNPTIGSKLGTTRDYYAFNPKFTVNDTLTVNPFILLDKEQSTDTAVYYVGANVDAKIDTVSAWGTAIYETGETANVDNAAYLMAVGADAGLVHGQFFYASGDDGTDATEDNTFAGPAGACYYWSEIMGKGIFDDTNSNNAPGTAVSDVMALNVGVTIKPMDKLTLAADLWYAQLSEDTNMGTVAVPDMQKDLGFEVDVKATYMILDNLKLDVVAAYLIAGDATGTEDPIELGTQLSFSF
ncbi:MAG: hypothetical protein KKD44_19490 [Proteobacteria bacterium]|nr:hypothetical protein [Pseudomonadota bacterium]